MPRKKKPIETELGAPAQYVDDAPLDKENIISDKIDLLPGLLVIHEDLDRLQLVDIEMSVDKNSPEDQKVVVTSMPMMGLRGQKRNEIIRKFKEEAHSLGYEIKKTITKIP